MKIPTPEEFERQTTDDIEPQVLAVVMDVVRGMREGRRGGFPMPAETHPRPGPVARAVLERFREAGWAGAVLNFADDYQGGFTQLFVSKTELPWVADARKRGGIL